MLPILLISISETAIKLKVEEVLKGLNLTGGDPDVMWITEQDGNGIETIKKVIDHFKLKPFKSEKKAAVIDSADDLTPEAQNSLLKILEEPTEYSVIILSAKSESSLIPTIISRCQKIYLEGEDDFNFDDWKEVINQTISADPEKRFELVEKTEDKEGFLKALIVYFKKNLADNTDSVYFTKILLQAEEWQKSNVNLRGILEYLMLKLDG